jgi:proteasome lid subunit RPN8/RPN11
MTTQLKPGAVSVTITSDAIDEIRRHGTETFPDECCGALIDVGGVIVEAFRLANTTSSGAARRFRIGPGDYRAAEARATERQGRLAGFYHSHPNEPARPSQYDLDHAWPNLTYVIISVNARVPGDITSWHLRDDRSAFDQGDLRWHTGS